MTGVPTREVGTLLPVPCGVFLPCHPLLALLIAPA